MRNGVTFSTFVSIAVSWAFAVIVSCSLCFGSYRAVVEVVLSSRHLLVSLLSILTVCMSQGPAREDLSAQDAVRVSLDIRAADS